MERVNLKIRVEASDVEGGAPFWVEGKELNDLPYADFVGVQGLLLELQGKLHGIGQAKAAEKARGPKK